jgi:hypothetical protein
MMSSLQQEAEKAMSAARELLGLADLAWLDRPYANDGGDPTVMLEHLLEQLLHPGSAAPVAEWDDEVLRRYRALTDAPIIRPTRRKRGAIAGPAEPLPEFRQPAVDPVRESPSRAQPAQADASTARHSSSAAPPAKWSGGTSSALFRVGTAVGRRAVTATGSEPNPLRTPLNPSAADGSTQDAAVLVPSARVRDVRRQADAQSPGRPSLATPVEVAPPVNAAHVLPFARSPGGPASTTPRQLTTLPELQGLLCSVVADSQSRREPIAEAPPEKSRRVTASAPRQQQSSPDRGLQFPLIATPHAPEERHDAVNIGGSVVPPMIDPLRDEMLLDRLLDRFEERLREQAIRHLGVTGGLT